MREANSAWEPVGHSIVDGVPLSAHTPARIQAPLPAMALLHGLEDGWQSWKPVADRLGDRFRCYAIDLPWRAGGSYDWRASATAAQWVDHALALIPEQVSVITAHSMGANSILHWLAADAARKVDAIVLLSPFYRLKSTPVDWVTFERSLAHFRTVMTEGLRVRLGERAHSLDSQILELMAEKMLDRIGPEGFLALFDTFISSSEMNLSQNKVPTLVVGGSADPGISGPRADALGDDMPVAQIRLEEELTHFCHAEQPDRVTELIVEFLRLPSPAHTKGHQ